MSNRFAKKNTFTVRDDFWWGYHRQKQDATVKLMSKPSNSWGLLSHLAWSCSDPKMYWRRIAGISRIISRVLRLVRTSKHGDVYQSTTIDNLLVSDGGTQGDHCTKKSGVIFNHPENSAVFYHVVAKLNSQLQIPLSIKISGITIAPNRSLKNHT